MANTPKCNICGEPMQEGEEMFKFHGYSGNCPKPPQPKPPTEIERLRALLLACRSSVKSDLNAYDRLSLAQQQQGDSNTIAETEVERLRILLDQIDDESDLTPNRY